MELSILVVVRQACDHRVRRGRDEICLVYALSAGAYNTTLYVMVNKVKGGGRGRAPLHLHQPGLIFHHYGMYARKRPLPHSVCTLCL
jgi:hypothetical protein